MMEGGGSEEGGGKEVSRARSVGSAHSPWVFLVSSAVW